MMTFSARLSGQTPPAWPAHRDADGFYNPFPGFEPRGFRQVLKWQVIDRLGRGAPEKGPPAVFETAPNDGSFLRANRTAFTATWIGQSTVLVQLGGINLLTDPVWSRRASPVSFAGPVRLTPPGVDFENLPEIHAVLISHGHYDHLDRATVRRLGDGPEYFVPLGLAGLVRSWGARRVHELDWGESVSAAGIEAVCLPAQHFSNRSPFDKDRTLWCSWLARNASGSFYFAGDTGYFPEMAGAGLAYGPVDLAAVPVGAYEPGWFMRPIHTDPEEAVRICLDWRAAAAVPVHWGTFDQSDEPPAHPPVRFAAAARAAGLDSAAFRPYHFGETRVIRGE